jgi:hypothetical protein
MEATYASETSVDFQQTTRRYNPEDGTHQLLEMFQGPCSKTAMYTFPPELWIKKANVVLNPSVSLALRTAIYACLNKVLPLDLSLLIAFLDL